MSNYTGFDCPVCQKAFAQDDDIVVCPQCGAPYHRACYQKTGHCVYQESHGADCDWKSRTHTHSNAVKLCPRCHAENSQEALFCAQCGQSLAYDSRAQGEPPTDSEQSYAGPGYAGPFPFDPMGGVSPQDHIEGITAGDMASFVRTNTLYYIGRFVNLSAFGRGRFHFAAFLFGGGWFLYRKQYVLGAILTAFQVVASVAAAFLQYYYTIPLMNELLPNAPANKYYWGFLQCWEPLVQKSPLTLFLVMLPTLLILLQFAQRIVCGVLANRLYLKYCVKKITEIKAQTASEQEYREKLAQKGGVNSPLAFSLMICYVIISLLPSFFNM